SALRHYSALDGFVRSSDSAFVSVGVALDRRTALRMSADASREYAADALALPALESGDADPRDPGSSILDGTRMPPGGSLALTRALGRRSALTVGYAARQAETRGAGERVVDQSATAEYSRRLGRDSSLRLDYAAIVGTRGLAAAGPASWAHDLQL